MPLDLVAAGAPELPAGWFYRVQGTGLHGLLQVTVRRPRLFGSKELGHASVLVWEFPNELRAIVCACTHAYRRAQAVQRAADARKYIGDYEGRSAA